MADISENSLPTPAIVIAVGAFAVTTTTHIRNIYLRSGQKRRQVTNFFSVSKNDTGYLNLLPLDTEIPPVDSLDKGESQPAHIYRQSIFGEIVKNLGTLKLSLEQALHDIYNHESLVKAGWGEKYNVPINIYLLADLKEPYAAGVILPLIHLLHNISENSTLCNVNVLLNTAVFPPPVDKPNSDQDLEVYSCLLELDQMFQDKSENLKKLTILSGYSCSSLSSMMVYLFDCRKEGSYVVRDNNQMQTMIGNALLALMEKDLAWRVSSTHNSFEIAEQQSYYNSIGAVALIYDPESLQKVCAHKLSHEFLKNEILNEDVDMQRAAHEAGIAAKKLGCLRDWLEQSVFQISPVVGQVGIDPETDELSILLANFKLAEMDYFHFHKIPWTQQIKDYFSVFEQEEMPQIHSSTSKNIEQFMQKLSNITDLIINSLPVKLDLYPSGICNASQALDLISDHLKKEQNKIKELKLALKQKQGSIAQDIEQKLEILQQLLDRAPKLPWIIRALPKFARIWAAPVYYSLRYGKKIFLLQNYKQECVDLLHTRLALLIEEDILNNLAKEIPGLIDRVETGKKDYQSLKEVVQETTKQLPSDWTAFPLGQIENGWDGIFRVPVAERNLAEWGYTKWHPVSDKWTAIFLQTTSPFYKWRSLSVELLTEWIDSLANEAYAPFWKLDLDQVFELWENIFTEFSSGQPVSPEWIDRSIASAYPLLKPDFDAIGGSGLSYISTHNLIADPEWRHFKVPPHYSDRSNIVFTSDPFVGIFLQIRHNVPLLSLLDMIRSGKQKYDALTTEKKLEYKIIHSPTEFKRPESTDIVDLDNPDIIHKTYHWKFRPKGSGIEIEQTIDLDISKSRFERYRRKPRFNGQWNRYSEEEMPEIRNLALEFQRLHAKQKWSTYNQAFNVLKFVQNCIPYTFDKDTTGHPDWARYPIETLMEGTGDCEDVAILCAAVIARLGFNTVLLLYPSHLAFGVAGADKLKGEYVVELKTGKRYFYGEATSDGWHLGQIPSNYQSIPPEEIYPVEILISEDEDKEEENLTGTS